MRGHGSVSFSCLHGTLEYTDKIFKTRTTLEGENISYSTPIPFNAVSLGFINYEGRGFQSRKGAPSPNSSSRFPFLAHNYTLFLFIMFSFFFSLPRLVGKVLCSASLQAPSGQPLGCSHSSPGFGVLKERSASRTQARNAAARARLSSPHGVRDASPGKLAAWAGRGPFKSRPRPSPPLGAAGGRWRQLRC